MTRRSCYGMLAFVLLAGALSPAQAQEPTLSSILIYDGETYGGSPWDVAVLPDGNVLFTEKCEGLYAVPLISEDSEGQPTYGEPLHLFGTDGAALVAADFICDGQTGAHGIALDPEFADNRWVYVFMPSNRDKPASGRAWNHVIRVTLADDLTSVSERTDIVTDLFFKESGNAVGSRGAHSGGRIRFGPDDLLYITTGDNHNQTLPQDLQALGGKVLRVNRDGSAADGNNTPEGGDPRIYTYGHRNVQGIAFEPSTGQPFIAEHGPGYLDEVTPLVPGGNGGWDPQDRAGLQCPGGYCGYAGNPETMPMTDLERFPDAMLPVWTYSGEKRGMGPAEFLSGEQWGDWEGDLLIGEMAAFELYKLILADGNVTAAEVISGSTEALPAARYRAVRQGPDGDLYVVAEQVCGSSCDRIFRISPTGAGSADESGDTPANSTPQAGGNEPADVSETPTNRVHQGHTLLAAAITLLFVLLL